MKGCRPLTDQEADLVARSFEGRHKVRDRALFVLGLKTGRRISQLLSLSVEDVLGADGEVVDRVWFARRACKGKHEGQAVPLSASAREALAGYLAGTGATDGPLFRSQKGGAITRVQAAGVLKAAYRRAGLSGKVATHSMRKTFAQKAYEKTDGNVFTVQLLLGHRSPASTVAYLSPDQEGLDRVFMEMG